MKHSWILSTSRPDTCIGCGELRGPDSNKEECIPRDWLNLKCDIPINNPPQAGAERPNADSQPKRKEQVND